MKRSCCGVKSKGVSPGTHAHSLDDARAALGCSARSKAYTSRPDVRSRCRRSAGKLTRVGDKSQGARLPTRPVCACARAYLSTSPLEHPIVFRALPPCHGEEVAENDLACMRGDEQMRKAICEQSCVCLVELCSTAG